MKKVNVKNKKIALVIQGPLLSIGKGGHNAHISQNKLKKSDLVCYDCRENIKKLINDFGSLFDLIVISTWDNQIKASDQWPAGVKIVAKPDPGGIERPGLYKERNKYRMFTGIKNALDEIDKINKKIDYVVRIRTDQYLDLWELIKSFFRGLNNTNKNCYRNELIFVPLFRPVDFTVADFYFASTLQAMKKFCNAILSYDNFEFFPNVHREIILKHAYVLYKKKINVPDWAYFPRLPQRGASRKTKRIFRFMFENIYFSLSPETFRSIIFRGSPFTEKYLSSRLRRKDLQSQKERNVYKKINQFFLLKKYNVPALASIDWERYFTFCQKFKGIELSWRNKLVIKAGKVGWDLWLLFRRIVSIIKRLVLKRCSR